MRREMSNRNKVLIVDTETTGLPVRYNAPVEEVANWPRLVQIAWAVVDQRGPLIGEIHSLVIRPDGFEIPAAATAIHGITHKDAAEMGVAITFALNCVLLRAAVCDLLVCHNVDYDRAIVGAELVRQGWQVQLASWLALPTFCTMRRGAELTRIQTSRGWKWPRLEELYAHLFHRVPEHQHDAAGDVAATIEIYAEMRRLGHVCD